MRGRAALNLLLVAAAAAPLLLAAADFAIAEGNRALQAEVANRQRVITEGTQLAHANQTLARQIALAAIKTRDPRLSELLSRGGITVKVSPGPPAGNGKTE